ncbi:cytochrome p450 [Lentinula edodes]|uniref:Ribosome biogenesis protein SLX9 n=1 Tax=Lentinula edodes TaxID=5353 RepID=A0A1Q3EQE6_LENED|nr:cytochrome p450 [Lentinula edodes]
MFDIKMTKKTMHRFQSSASKGSYPPGPKVVNMPTLDAWVKYRDWGNKYGDLVYLPRWNTLITNDAGVAIDLLEKRARIYSDRAMSPIMKLCGGENLLSVECYSDKWRKDRRVFQQTFRQAAIGQFYPAQYNKVHEFLRELLLTPEDLTQHVNGLSQGLIPKALYGLDIGPEDALASKVAGIIDTFGKALLSGSFPAYEWFPFLIFMPSWFPGCGFKRIANECGKVVEEIYTVPFDLAMNNMQNGTRTSPIVELAMQKPQDIKEIKAMGTMSFIGAIDTTMSSISSFILVMCLHPNAQTKGQEEIDRVIGKDRLPTFEDRRHLPYVEAIYREVMRLHPPVPLGFPHISMEDDSYRCAVVANIWAMNRNPNVYQDPDRFLPERHLKSAAGPFESIDNIYAYGFGRRVCAGRYMADNTIWLTVASVLAAFTMGKAKDGNGNEIDIPGKFTNHFFRPVSFLAVKLQRIWFLLQSISECQDSQPAWRPIVGCHLAPPFLSSLRYAFEARATLREKTVSDTATITIFTHYPSMPKVRSKRSTSHNASVKFTTVKSQFLEDDSGSPVAQTVEYESDPAPALKKKDKHQIKREAFLQRLELTQSPYSKSHQRRIKKKAKEQIGHGLEEIRTALESVDDSRALSTIAQDASATAGKTDKSQMKVDGDEDTPKSVHQSKVKSNQIGEGKGATLSNTQRKNALKIERLRYPLILSNPQFGSNPFQTIRTHAQNTLIKHVPT